MTTVIAQAREGDWAPFEAEIVTKVIGHMGHRELSTSLFYPQSDYAFLRKHVCREADCRAAILFAASRVASSEVTERGALQRLALIELSDVGIERRGSHRIAFMIADAVIAHRRTRNARAGIA